MRLRLPNWLAGNRPCQQFDSAERLFAGLKNLQTEAVLCAQQRVVSTLRHFMRQFGLPDALTDDLLNRSTLIFLQKIESGAYQFQGHAPTTYFVEIVKNVALQATRRQKHPTENLEDQVQLPDPTFENAQKRHEQKELVQLLLDQIGEPCASVVRLHHIEGYSDEEVVSQGLTKYSTTDSLKMKRSDCMKKLVQLAQAWKSKNI